MSSVLVADQIVVAREHERGSVIAWSADGAMFGSSNVIDVILLARRPWACPSPLPGCVDHRPRHRQRFWVDGIRARVQVGRHGRNLLHLRGMPEAEQQPLNASLLLDAIRVALGA